MLRYGRPKYRLRITTLSPLHIGTGRKLAEGSDYIYMNDRYWMVDVDRLIDRLDERGDAAKLSQIAARQPLDRILTAQSDFDAECMMLLRGARNNSPNIDLRVVHEQIKNMRRQTYIPGSSIKGALRTVLAFHGWAAQNMRLNVNQLSGGPKFVALPTERRVFVANRRGEASNYDLLRLIQMGDSAPDEKRRLLVSHIRVLSNGRNRGEIYLEAIPQGVTFDAFLTVDSYLRRDPAAIAELGWDDQHLGLLNMKRLPQLIADYSAQRLEADRVRWSSSTDPICDFYDQLKKLHDERDPETECLLQLGWGGGWDSKTFNTRLREDQAQFEALVTRYKVVHRGSYNPNWQVPKSRRVVLDADDAPVAAPGWVKIKIERVA